MGSAMNALFLILGPLLLAFVILDLLWTTLWVDGGAGPLSGRLTTWLWRGLRAVGGKRPRTLSLAGPLAVVLTLLVWVTLIWAGWTLLFAGDQLALIDTRNQEPVTWAGRIYFVGYSMFTMGNGDYSPAAGWWQIATGLTTASGMLFVTLAVSYVLSVLSAVVQKRAFASGVTGLGARAEDIVARAWDGTDLHALDLPLSGLAAQLDRLSDQHNTYPVLHYYHSEKQATASAVAVAMLDEALTLVKLGVPAEHQPNAVVLEGARSSVEGYLRSLSNAYIRPADDAPDPPTLDPLRRHGIPTVDDATFLDAIAGLAERRKKLLGMVREDAWPWPERVA
jgi:hypothetical protein